LGIGDWGLGIAQSPIPNPQFPIITRNQLIIVIIYIINYNFIIECYIMFKINFYILLYKPNGRWKRSRFFISRRNKRIS